MSVRTGSALVRRLGRATSILSLIFLPAVARADFVWPALVLEGRILTWWAILAGLLVEWPIVRLLTGATWLKAFGFNLLTNLASTLVGVLLIPASGLLWEFSLGNLLYKRLSIGTFNPGTWAATVLLAAAVNALLEGAVLRWSAKVRFTGRVFGWLFLANFASVGLAMGSLYVSPPKHF